MKLALLGYGKMGKLIESLALSKKYEVLAKINSSQQDWARAQNAEVWIDFSHASLVETHAEKALASKKNLLIGTTGWDTKVETIQKKAREAESAILYAPNCSLGVLLFMKIVERAADLMGQFKEYDVAGFEMHHREKKDSPSGTAQKLSFLLKNKHHKEVPFSSLRLGSIIGKHQVLYDSPIDTLTLTHEAKNRNGFASGALELALWLRGKQGFFTLEDYIEEKLNSD
jgi:4-hydroxy-tetrahydrodipicolinate reductase